MTTATNQIPHRDFTPLPTLEKSRIDPLVASLNPDLASAAQASGDLFAKAIKVRGQFETKRKEIHNLRAEDTERLSQAYLSGKDGKPGDRKAEDKALAEADEAHRKAEALTKASNHQVNVVYAAVRSEAGKDVKASAHDEIRTCAKELATVAAKSTELLHRISELEGVIEAVEHSERDDTYSMFSNVVVRAPEVGVHGRNVNAMSAAAAIAALAEGRMQDEA